MPATARRNQGKTEFVKEVLTKNPHANAQAVRDEWTATGHSGIDQPDAGQQAEILDGPGGESEGRSSQALRVGRGREARLYREEAGSEAQVGEPQRARVDRRRADRRRAQGEGRRAARPTVADRGRHRSSALPGDEPGRPGEHRRQPASDPPPALPGPHSGGHS